MTSTPIVCAWCGAVKPPAKAWPANTDWGIVTDDVDWDDIIDETGEEIGHLCPECRDKVGEQRMAEHRRRMMPATRAAMEAARVDLDAADEPGAPGAR